MSKKIRKTLMTAVLIVTFMANCIVSAAAEHNHVYRVYDKIYFGEDVEPCNTPGCMVTIKHYTVRYRCSCGSEFARNEDEYAHSMHH